MDNAAKKKKKKNQPRRSVSIVTLENSDEFAGGKVPEELDR